MSRRLHLWAFLIFSTVLLAACASPGSESTGPTPTPLPTTTAPQFPVVAPQACQLARFPAMRTRQAQGDLIAWSPDGSYLAYTGPAPNSNWFSGLLFFSAAPDFLASPAPASDLLVFGDLTWAPDSSRLAFIVFRQPDVYSLAVASPDGSAAQDLYSNADPRTDLWSSSKAMQAWRSPSVLRFLSSCGDDCDQTYEVDLNTGIVQPVGEQVRKAKDRLWPEPHELAYDETIYPVMWQETWESRLSPQMKRPTWTLDGTKVAYIDRTITAWVLRVDRSEQYLLDTPFVDVQELKWSPDGRYLALRTDDDIYVFDTECSP